MQSFLKIYSNHVLLENIPSGLFPVLVNFHSVSINRIVGGPTYLYRAKEEKSMI